MRKIEQYTVKEGRTPLSGAELTQRFLDIDGRLHQLEELTISWKQAVVEVQNYGLERINNTIQPVLDQANILMAEAQTKLAAIKGQWQGIVDEWDELADRLTAIHEEIDAALAEAVTLTSDQTIEGKKTFSTPPVTVAPTAQDNVARWQDTLPAQL